MSYLPRNVPNAARQRVSLPALGPDFPEVGNGIPGLPVRSWTPDALFANDEEGAWYDPSDLSTMFKGTDGTGAVAVGDLVGYIADKSGNGNHAIQGTPAARPALRQDAGGKYYLEFDGTDDKLINGSLEIAAHPITFAVAAQFANASNQIGNVFDGSNTHSSGATAKRSVLGTTTSSNFRLWAGTALSSPVSSRDTATCVLVGALNGASSALYKNGQSVATGNAGTQTLQGLTLGGEWRDSNLTQQFAGRFYGGVVVAGAPELTLLTEYLAAKSGVTL